MHASRLLRRRTTPILAVAAGWLLLAGASGCASRPTAGEVVHARVILRVGERLLDDALEARAGAGGGSLAVDPGRTSAILGLVADGATREDARAGRLLLTSCRWGGDSGAAYAVLLPAGVLLPEGDRVELELVVGTDFPGDVLPDEEAGQRGRFVRVLPHRATGRTHCDPAANR